MYYSHISIFCIVMQGNRTLLSSSTMLFTYFMSSLCILFTFRLLVCFCGEKNYNVKKLFDIKFILNSFYLPNLYDKCISYKKIEGFSVVMTYWNSCLQLRRKPGVNFINKFTRSFTRTDPKSAIKTTTWLYFLVLLGSAQFNAACKMLVKLTHLYVRIKFHSSRSTKIWN